MAGKSNTSNDVFNCIVCCALGAYRQYTDNAHIRMQLKRFHPQLKQAHS